jgi:glycosyltransferase involved in cell wall biosynthesis
MDPSALNAVTNRQSDSSSPPYDAVIRTDHASALLERCIAALRQQTAPPRRILIVDSSRDLLCRERLLELSDFVIQYPAIPFNFAHALNLGIEAAEGIQVLLLSSHVILDNRTLIEEGRTLGRQHDTGVVYWKPTTLRSPRLQITEGRTFDGYNGLSAVCALVPRAETLARPFRTEVFSAEDQEWAGWYLRAKAGRALQIEHPDLEYLNPKKNIQKSINEEISIAYFTNRNLLRPRHIAFRILRAGLATLRNHPDRARLHWEIAKGLCIANFKQPNRESRYY